ncbi:single-stranded DNA-binding protein [mine drainage metagenome]|uniref:Single-stranded DNA-binding protein n=1 Tax=mine drainage metagenome TaxID=410659 RepID=A0A1J5PS88_9ZZZZ
MSLNTLILTGNLGSDPRIALTTTGKQKASFSIATSRTSRAADGTKTQQTEWTPVIAWGRLASRAEKLLAKGAYILVQGEKRTRTYTDGDGVLRSIVELVAQDFRLLSHKAAN